MPSNQEIINKVRDILDTNHGAPGTIKQVRQLVGPVRRPTINRADRAVLLASAYVSEGVDPMRAWSNPVAFLYEPFVGFTRVARGAALATYGYFRGSTLDVKGGRR